MAAYDDGNSNLAIEQLEPLSELDAAYQREALRESLLFACKPATVMFRPPPTPAPMPSARRWGRFGKALALRPRNVEERARKRELANRFLGVRQALGLDYLAFV